VTAFPGTIPELLAWRAAEARAQTPAFGRPWLLFEGDSWTLGDVYDGAGRVAVGLAERGVVRGDRVALLLGNRPEALLSWLGINRLGAICTQLNAALRPPELAGLLALTTPRVLVTDEHRPVAEAGCARLEASQQPLIVSPDELGRAGGAAGAPAVEVHPDDVAVLIATSGTTGAPKAVAQTHRVYTLTAEAFPWWLGLGEQAYSTMGALGAGASLAMLPRFSASRFWDEARRLGATQVNLIGAMMNILLATEARPADRDHGLRTCYSALALPEERHRGFEERFGTRVVVGYGMSETTFGTIWPRGEPPRHGTMGTLRQHPRLGNVNRARVVDDDGRDVADGQTGELWLQSPGTMAGYWASPAETAAALTDGWLHTGDLVSRDADGWFRFVARKKDVIRRRGENIAAAEIENALLAHTSIAEAAAVGVPSPLGEDEIVAYVVVRAGATWDEAAVRAFLGERLAGFKIPGTFQVREALPRTATERVAKHLLK
jgi:crotonobetaine/carnitine-CoA ligase